MPFQHPCNETGCPRLTVERYCAEHKAQRQREYDEERGSAAVRGYTTLWRRLRLMVLRRNPVCAMCKDALATEVDHIIAKRKGGTDALSNLQGLCKACHARKTIQQDGGFGK